MALKSEPVVKVATVTAAVVAALSLLAAFGVPVTDEQSDAIVQVAAIVAPFVVAFVARRKVSPARDDAQSESTVAGSH